MTEAEAVVERQSGEPEPRWQFKNPATGEMLNVSTAEIQEALFGEPEPPTTVTEALARVMTELPGIGKDNRSEQGYNYRGIEAITAHAQALFGKYGIVYVPHVRARVVKELTINGKPWTEDQLEVVYEVFGPSHGKVRSRRVLVTRADGGQAVFEIDEVVEDKIEIGPIYGLGRDNSDKGSNKSLTQTFKYALIQALCIGDRKDDADQDQAHEADPRLSFEERFGWKQEEAAEAGREAQARIAGLLEGEKISQERARALWQGYRTPGGEDRPRTKKEHAAWMAEPIEPDSPQSFEEAAAAEAAAAPAPTPPEPAEAAPGGFQPPEDNGHRDGLDKAYDGGTKAGLEALLSELSKLTSDEATRGLVARDVHEEDTWSMDADALRRNLGSIIIRNGASDKAKDLAARAKRQRQQREESAQQPSLES